MESTQTNTETKPKTVVLRHSSGSTCEINVAGGHLFSWKINEIEQIFVSSKTKYLPEKPIRGGVPICFP
jgi:glucose-6-phosphate 1-epimerase